MSKRKNKSLDETIKEESESDPNSNSTESSHKKPKLASIFSRSNSNSKDSNPNPNLTLSSSSNSNSTFWRDPPDPIPNRHDGAFSGVLLGIHLDPFRKFIESNKKSFESEKGKGKEKEKEVGKDVQVEKGKGKEKMVEDKNENQKEKEIDIKNLKKAKVVAFDLDGTIIRPQKGKKFPSATDSTDHELVFPNQIIKKFQSLHESGSIILILSNQKQTKPPTTSSKSKSKSSSPEISKKLKTWKQKMKDIFQVWNIPMIIIGSLNDDLFRKPKTGMFELFFELLKERIQLELKNNDSSTQQNSLKFQDLIDSEESIFIGDAAGRLSGNFKGKKALKDWNDTDRKFAINCGLKFQEPESYFLGEEARPFELSGWKPTLQDETEVPIPSEEEILNPSGNSPISPVKPDVVLFVGPPGSGKSSFYRKYFEKKGYVWVNQDQLKTRDKCLSLMEESLKKGKSCVVDNTNRDHNTRDVYIQRAKPHGALVRCIFFDIPKLRCEHNSKFRAWGNGISEPSLPLIPGIAISTFFSGLEPPPISEDGSEEKKLGFGARTIRVRWEWNDEDGDGLDENNLSERDQEKRKRYLRWYS